MGIIQKSAKKFKDRREQRATREARLKELTRLASKTGERISEMVVTLNGETEWFLKLDKPYDGIERREERPDDFKGGANDSTG